MIRVFILGGSGMLGHKMLQLFQKEFSVIATCRGPASELTRHAGLVETAKIVPGLATDDVASLEAALRAHRPDVVINAVGIIKQIEQARNPRSCLKVNSLLPHDLASICGAIGARLFLISTDCVFDGVAGNYLESDLTNATDLYGRTKALGEISNIKGVTTLRTSIVGRELSRNTGLLEWYLSQPPGSKVKGFRRAIYTGVTTGQLSEVICMLIHQWPLLDGLFQVVSQRIDKYELLCRFRDTFRHRVDIEPVDEPEIDRSMRGDLLFEKVGIAPFSWEQMMVGLAEDAAPYLQWRKHERV